MYKWSNKWTMLVAVAGLVWFIALLIPTKAPSDVEIVANHICHNAINPDNYQYKPNSKGEVAYKIRMQKCTAGWERLLSSDPVFLAKEKAAYSL